MWLSFFPPVCPSEYRPPYDDMVPPDPSMETMYEVVAVKGKRPHIPVVWHENKVRVNIYFTHMQINKFYSNNNLDLNLKGSSGFI